MVEEKCMICRKPGTLCCSCKLVPVCKDHQSSHRRDDYCFPFIIKKKRSVGRFYVATRDIQPLEVILTEQAASTGPYTKSPPQCLGCGGTKALTHPCSRCGFPLCGVQCELGRHSVECSVFTNVGFKAKVKGLGKENPLYAAVAVIRLIQLRETNQSAYSQLMKFEHHNEQRRREEPQLWEYHQKHVVQFITQTCQLKISENEVNQVIGAMFTNSIDIELPAGFGRENGFYPTYAYMNHTCRCNSKTFKFPDQRLEVRAQVLISQGEEISTQYLQPMKPTFIRRPLLQKKWYFECSCSRCVDATECATFFSALLCRKAKCRGAVVPVRPTDGESEWLCRDCGTEIDVGLVIQIISTVTQQMDCWSPKQDPVVYFEKLISLYSNILHPNHYINHQMKEKLAILYGNLPKYPLLNLSRPQLDRKSQLCQDVLSTLSKLDPGYCRIRANIQGELNKTRRLTVEADIKRGILTRKSAEKLKSAEQEFLKYIQLYKNIFFKSE